MGAWTSAGRDTFQLNFNNLSENIFIDPVNHTIRQVGEISYTPSASSLTFTQTQVVNSAAVPGTFTIQMALNSAPTLHFDIIRGFSYGTQYQFLIPQVDCNTSYSLETGGQTYVGSSLYSLFGAYGSGTYFSVSSDPNFSDSITINYIQANLDTFYGTQSGGTLTGANGFSVNFQIGSLFQNQTGHENMRAYFPGSVIATLVPEPSVFALGGGAICLILMRRCLF